jgi:hypothetical protein
LGSGSANQIVVAGAAAASNPTITATGTDTNISVNIVGKGTGGVVLGAAAGKPILAHYSATATLTFGSVSQTFCANQNITVTGAAVGDTVVATPDSTAGGVQTLPFNWNAWVSAVNTVSVRICALQTANPVAGVWRADVWHH